jgi:membrane protein implicated in regulation of membrane protease activity
MPTNNIWIKPLLIVMAIVLAVGILWLGAMLLMHLMMMGAPDAMGAGMGVTLLVLILLGVLVLVLWRRGVSNKKEK